MNMRQIITEGNFGFYILALIIGYGINELLGTILLIGWIIYIIVSK